MIRIGLGRQDVTPPKGATMAAFPVKQPSEPRHAEGAWDPLYVKALAISDGDATACVVVGDLTGWRKEDLDPIREGVTRRRPDISPESLLFCATHTHSSMDSTYLFGSERGLPALQEGATEAILQALDDLAPGALAVGRAEAPYNHNRRIRGEAGEIRMSLEYNPGVSEGVTDPTMTVLRFDRQGRDTIALVHWTAHALCLGSPNRKFSADYPGALAAHVEERLPGSRVVFMNGAAGNLHPHRCMRGDDEALRWMGAKLGERAIEAVRAATPVDLSRLDVETEVVEFQNRTDASSVVAARVSCLRLIGSEGQAEVVIGFLPGEQYVEFQVALRQALAPSVTLVAGYSGSRLGYVPTRQAFAEGGYGVVLFDRDPPDNGRTMVQEDTGERMLEALIRLARRG